MDWDDFARPWLDAAPDLELAHRPVLAALMDAAQLRPGERVLDIGCGTGPSLLAAAKAVGPTGHITGIDIAPPLIARAAERVPDTVDLIVGDAGAHPYPAGKPFDLILSNFGTMFFGDTQTAMAHLRGAVETGARLAASVWSSPAHNPWFAVPRAIVDEVIADVPRPDPSGPGPMRFADPAPFIADLEAAGWRAQAETVQLALTPPGRPEEVAALHMKVTAGMMVRGLDVDPALLAEVERRLVADAQTRIIDGAVHIPAEVHIVTAVAV